MNLKIIVKHLPLSALKPHPRNPRVHPEPGSEKWEALKKSLTNNYFDPIVWNERNGLLVSGHLRRKVMQEMGVKKADCVVVDLGEVEHMAMLIRANRETGAWDDARLVEMLASVNASMDIDLTGFSKADYGMMLDEQAPEEAEDKVDVDKLLVCGEQLRKKYGVELGQTWKLGEHLIRCGNSEDATDVAELLKKGKPHLMVTDPPYGVEYDANWRNTKNLKHGKKHKGRSTGVVENDSQKDWRNAWALFTGDVAYVWHSGLWAPLVHNSLTANQFEIRSQIIWQKNAFAVGRGDYHWQHEACWYAVRQNKRGHWNGDRTQATIWPIDRLNKNETGHSTQKPLECMARPIRNNSKRGDLVYEPFSGSGTTIIACEELGRVCRAMELNPAYVAVAIQRWSESTGKEPKKV